MPSWKKIVGYPLGGLVALSVIGAIAGDPDQDSKSSSAGGGPSAARASTPPEPELPQLVIRAPDDRDVFRDRVTVSGRIFVATSEGTSPAAADLQGARVTVNGKTAPVRDGEWSKTVTVKPGENRIEIAASGPGFASDDESTTLTRKRTKAERAALAARRAARAAERKQRYLASAKTIPYNQLEKNPDRFYGERIKLTGQIFQIQEDLGSTIILLSVTNEGYGFWSDNVWVDVDGTINSAEDDIITVYGTVQGTKSYETQIGGETYVPQVKARYVEE